MHCPTKHSLFGDFIFDFYENVYEPAEDSFLFAENLEIEFGSSVLDIGAGCGILSVLAARKAGHLIAVDLNPYAVRCAKQNAGLNHVRSKMDFLQADLLSALSADAAFDSILFNAPYLPSDESESTSWIAWSWAGGSSGRRVIDRFIIEAPSHLKPGGKVLLMQSTLTGLEETLFKFREQGLTPKVKAERKLPFFETLTLIEAKK